MRQTKEQLVTQFASVGCGCSRKCSAQFSLNYIRDLQKQCYNLIRGELDMVILGQLLASTNASDKVVIESEHLEQERQKRHTTFHHAGKIVCQKTFKLLHTVGSKRLKNLGKNLRQNGLTARQHGNVHNGHCTHFRLSQLSMLSVPSELC